jgi:hypothetical protein
LTVRTTPLKNFTSTIAARDDVADGEGAAQLEDAERLA